MYLNFIISNNLSANSFPGIQQLSSQKSGCQLSSMSVVSPLKIIIKLLLFDQDWSAFIKCCKISPLKQYEQITGTGFILLMKN